MPSHEYARNAFAQGAARRRRGGVPEDAAPWRLNRGGVGRPEVVLDHDRAVDDASLIASISVGEPAGTTLSKLWCGARPVPSFLRVVGYTPPANEPSTAAPIEASDAVVDPLEDGTSMMSTYSGPRRLVDVDADVLDVAAALVGVLDRRHRAEADGAGDGEDDVGAFLMKACAWAFPGGIREVAVNEPLLLHRIPAQRPGRWRPSACCSSDARTKPSMKTSPAGC
jgi:hypothetical protein